MRMLVLHQSIFDNKLRTSVSAGKAELSWGFAMRVVSLVVFGEMPSVAFGSDAA